MTFEPDEPCAVHSGYLVQFSAERSLADGMRVELTLATSMMSQARQVRFVFERVGNLRLNIDAFDFVPIAIFDHRAHQLDFARFEVRDIEQSESLSLDCFSWRVAD